MQEISIEGIINNYRLLSDPDLDVQEKANLYLMRLIDCDSVWKITEEMILRSEITDFQLLGAQILYQKVQRDIKELELAERLELKTFIFNQLTNDKLNLPTIRKLASSGALIAIYLMLDHWPTFISDMVLFMQSSTLHLRNGLVLLQRLPEELKYNNHILHGHKMMIKDALMNNSDLLCKVYIAAIMLTQETLTDICLDGLESWIQIGFPLMKYVELVKLLLGLMKVNELCLESCCKIIKQGLAQSARQKYQSLSESEFQMQRERYSSLELQSLSIILTELRDSKPNIIESINLGNNSEQIEIYSSIIKEILLSYSFLLKENIGYELLQLMFAALQKGDLKLSYSTFDFWVDFCERLGKIKVENTLANKFWSVVDHLLDVLIGRCALDLDTLTNQMLKDQETVDDLNKINIAEYRKEAQYIFKFTFDYFNAKREKQGSLLYFRKALEAAQSKKNKGQGLPGLQLSIYIVKSALESMVSEADTANTLDFISYIMGQMESASLAPPRLLAEVLNLIKDCNRQIKQQQSLFLRCLAFCLKQVSNEPVSHYAVYAFQSLMESINELNNPGLVGELMDFYMGLQVNKETVLEKVLEGILTTITKLTNREAMQHYLLRIVNGVENKQLKKDNNSVCSPAANYLALIEIKTLLDSFDHFNGADQQYFRNAFLKISSLGIELTTNLIENYLSTGRKFTSVGDLGASMSVVRNSLRICQHSELEQVPLSQYIKLMNVVMKILSPQLFGQYSNLTEIIVKVLTQFVGERVPILDGWLGSALPAINNFFLTQMERFNITTVDPDFLKCYFSIAESVLIYNRDLYLAQNQHTQIFDLLVMGIQHINERGFQRKAVSLLYQCVQLRQVYSHTREKVLRVIFAVIPSISNICHANVGRILMILLENVDLRGKENITRQLLEYEPYLGVNKDIKEILAKFVAFAVESKVDRYIKGAINDLTEVRWKQSGAELALHLELRFTKWRREYQQTIKSGNIPQ